MEPTRKGRCCGAFSPQEQYLAKKVSAQEAAAQIRDQDRIACTGGGTWPQLFDRALADTLRQRQIHITLRTLFMLERPAVLDESCREYVQFQSGFFGVEREAVPQGNVDFVPFHLGRTRELHRRLHPRVVVMAVSPPDENGWMSRSIWGTHITRDTFESGDCEVLIAEVNDQLPYIYSSGERHTMVHVSEVDYIIEGSYSWPETKSHAPTEIERRLAAHIADRIPDGACIQLGFGGLADAVGAQLGHFGKKDLGLHTEVMTNCTVNLIKNGVITNRKKALCPGRSVAAAVVGDRRLWEFCHRNPDVCLKEVDWVNDPANLSKNEQVVSVNGAMEIDLTGQVAAEAIGAKQYTGTGGQLQWVTGAQWSRGGMSFIAMPSTYFDKASRTVRSKIKAVLKPGSIITTPRTCVQYVATEYGVADLSYKTLRQRAESLIEIAHPDFREDLRRTARHFL
ncbi:acetyl-CoA hydrolase/transferase family protein [Oscillibacter sp.]|uniref:acetyl-CoA hydrolase/transferase family protein n=1 Tax=Oscillibacter sp. TaxID=1945593 RepID=UPI002D7FDFC5|nr:acetyl-CoA hydrolase/transferase C-terminal domain-containing protein [Oscillibacter sp.]